MDSPVTFPFFLLRTKCKAKPIRMPSSATVYYFVMPEVPAITVMPECSYIYNCHARGFLSGIQYFESSSSWIPAREHCRNDENGFPTKELGNDKGLDFRLKNARKTSLLSYPLLPRAHDETMHTLPPTYHPRHVCPSG